MSQDGLSLGQFHEISVSTDNLAESLQFYELMGFTKNQVGPVWPHPYSVVSLGSLVIGLHEYRFPSPSITCVHQDIEGALESYRDAGAVIAFAKTDSGQFKEFGFRDPAGHMVTLLERVTHHANALDPNVAPSGDLPDSASPRQRLKSRPLSGMRLVPDHLSCPQSIRAYGPPPCSMQQGSQSAFMMKHGSISLPWCSNVLALPTARSSNLRKALDWS